MTVINVTGSCTINVVGSAVINVHEEEGGGGGQAGEVPGNLIGNGAFGTDLAGWVVPEGDESVTFWSGGKLTNIVGDNDITRPISALTIGTDYVFSLDVEMPDGGTIGPVLIGGGGELSVPDVDGYTTNGSKTFSFTASHAFDALRIDFRGEGGPGYTVDNVTLLPA